MNLFDMIFRNSRSKEVVFSSVYNYLVHRFETHGLGPLILERIIDALPNEDARRLVSRQGLEVQNTEAEYSLGEVGQIDSMIELSTKDASRSVYLFTEVKITDSSARNVTGHGSQVRRYAEYIHTKVSEDSVFLYLVPDTDSATALREFAAFITDAPASIRNKSFVMCWRDTQPPETTLPAVNACHKSFETIIREVLQDEQARRIPPVSTGIRFVLRSLINTVHNNFNREQIVYEHGRFPDRSKLLGNLPAVHRLLFEYLEERSGSRRNVSPSNTSIGFPYSDSVEGKPNTLFRFLTMKYYRRTAAEIMETDYADKLIIELNETIWDLDDHMKDTLAALFKGTAHVAFHQYHPNGRNNEKATWILFNEGIDTESLPQVKTQIDEFWGLAEERFRAFLNQADQGHKRYRSTMYRDQSARSAGSSPDVGAVHR